MKYVIVLALVFLVAWRWRTARSSAVTRKPASHQPPPAHTTDMLACAHCGLHLPSTDALPGQQGHYCSTAHRRAAEG